MERICEFWGLDGVRRTPRHSWAGRAACVRVESRHSLIPGQRSPARECRQEEPCDAPDGDGHQRQPRGQRKHHVEPLCRLCGLFLPHDDEKLQEWLKRRPRQPRIPRIEGIANVKIHGTTGERPLDRLVKERPKLHSLPDTDRLGPFLREIRKVQRDGFVAWQGAFYGVPARLAGQDVEVQPRGDTVEIWASDSRVALHPRATRVRQRFIAPGQWDKLDRGDRKPPKEALATLVPEVAVEKRSLSAYGMAVAR